jgi:hypothetical protein
VSQFRLPDSVDDDVAKSLVGDYPNLKADSFPVKGEGLDLLGGVHSVEVEPERFDYFIEFRS